MSQRSRYEQFPKGKYGLPHMGAVITYYRQKRGWTQEYLSIVADVDKQTVAYWESSMYLQDVKRRVLLCRILSIPYELLGLTWRSVVEEGEVPTQAYLTARQQMIELLLENTYGLYEELLAFGYEGVDNKGISPEMAYRFRKHQQELETIVATAPEVEKAEWVDLLGRFYQLLISIAQQHQQAEEALDFANKAVDFAFSTEDSELRGSALYRRARIHLIQGRPEDARVDITSALDYAKIVRTPLTGSIYLLAAEINALYARDDEKLREQCKAWQDAVVHALYNSKIEPDGSFLRLNLAAVHHERVKTLTRFALFHASDEELVTLLKQPHIRADSKLLKEANNAMVLAWENLPTGFTGWEKNFYITEARMYLVGRDLENSARSAKKALSLAEVLHSHKVKAEAHQLYVMQAALESENPYVRNLGVALGIFS